MAEVVPDPDLLRACLEAPKDDAPRLALADWLEERGWGDRLLPALLREAGEWHVDGESRALWWVQGFEGAVLGLYGGALKVDPGEDEAVGATLTLSRAPPDFRCCRCRKTANLHTGYEGRMACPNHRHPPPKRSRGVRTAPVEWPAGFCGSFSM